MIISFAKIWVGFNYTFETADVDLTVWPWWIRRSLASKSSILLFFCNSIQRTPDGAKDMLSFWWDGGFLVSPPPFTFTIGSIEIGGCFSRDEIGNSCEIQPSFWMCVFNKLKWVSTTPFEFLVQFSTWLYVDDSDRCGAPITFIKPWVRISVLHKKSLVVSKRLSHTSTKYFRSVSDLPSSKVKGSDLSIFVRVITSWPFTKFCDPKIRHVFHYS